MSEQDPPGTPDEGPLIGGPLPSPPPSDVPEGAPDVASIPPRSPPKVAPWDSRQLRRDRVAPHSHGRDGPGAGYYAATNRAVRRTAIVYSFTLATIVIGGLLIFVLFRVLNQGDDEEIASRQH